MNTSAICVLTALFAFVCLVQCDSTTPATLIQCGPCQPEKKKPNSYKYESVQFSPLFGKSLKGNFFFAFHYCASIGMQVATPHTPEKLTALADFMKEEELENVWTSGNDLAIDGTFAWLVNGKPLRFRDWHTGRPDNVEKDEHCLSIWHKEGAYKMADRKCSEEYVVVCEPQHSPF